MNRWKFLLRSCVHYRKSHLWVVLGTLLTTAVLVGALAVGDSVRFSLREIVFERLGRTEFAISSGDRFFRTALAGDLSDRLGTEVAPVLMTKGIAVVEGGERRINGIQVVGVDSLFWRLGNSQDFTGHLSSGQAVVNRHLADRLSLQQGDAILLRIGKTSAIPQDAPLSLDSVGAVTRRLEVGAVASDEQFGRFNLKADQISPDTVFVAISTLSGLLDLDDRANILLVAEREGNPLGRQEIDDALRETWKLADAGLEIEENAERQFIELRSLRVFLAPAVVEAALILGHDVRPLLTYFVNDFRSEEGTTPYSFVSAPGAPLVPEDMADDEIIINAWLAEDLKAAPGDEIGLSYYVLGPGRSLEEKQSRFRIKSVVPLRGLYWDEDLLPRFPGLHGAENCRDWDPGIPIDLDRIRDKDEDYWDLYRGTPKAFITQSAALTLWRNRFGDFTAVRFFGHTVVDVEKHLLAVLDPASLGFSSLAVREDGLGASSQSVNFSQLFLGLSFFVILAGLLLSSLFFVFNTEGRAEENGLLLALGFPRKTVRGMVFLEGAGLVIIGSLLGSLVGIFYNTLILMALKTVWRGAVGTSSLHTQVSATSVLTGVGIGILASSLTIWLVIRRQVRLSIAGLKRGLAKVDTAWNKKPKTSVIVAALSAVAVVFIVLLTDPRSGNDALVFFFVAGFLLLTGGLALSNILLSRIGRKKESLLFGITAIGLRNNARNRIRSLTLVGLLACGLFIIFTVGANRISALQDAEKRTSGTGGFVLFGESTLPVLYDLNSAKGREFYRLAGTPAQEAEFVQFRVREGDDASCLNLNRVSSPRLIGVDPHELRRRRAFTFADLIENIDRDDPWPALDLPFADGSIPAVADQSVIVWGLGKAVGDTLLYADERGATYSLKLIGGLANSVFQGNIIISERIFLEKYPTTSGYRLFLVDAPPERSSEVANAISWSMEDIGLDLTPTATRLAQFNTVQNTYLAIFLILGSFGFLLGSIGLGVVVWRNINERRGELALLRAVGFSRKNVKNMIMTEHTALLLFGIVWGVAAALLATLPALLAPGTQIPVFTLMIVLALVILNGGIWTYSAASLGTKGNLMSSLREE